MLLPVIRLLHAPADCDILRLPESGLHHAAGLALGLQIDHPPPFVPIDAQNHLSSCSLGSAWQCDGVLEDQLATADLGYIEGGPGNEQHDPHVRRMSC